MRQNIGDVGVQNKRKATDWLLTHPVFPSTNEFYRAQDTIPGGASQR